MKKFLLIILSGLFTTLHGQEIQPVRPKNFTPYNYTFKVEQLYNQFSKSIIDQAKKDSIGILKTISHGSYKPDSKLDLHRLPEWFKDAKFGIFCDWGLWSVAGYGQKGYHGNYYPDTYLGYMYEKDGQKMDYHKQYWGNDFERDDFIPLFTASGFNSDTLARLCNQWGARYVIPFAKHMDGYCIWNNSYTHRNSVKMPPHRDLLKEMYDSFRKYNLKCGFYYCLYEFEFPIIHNNKIVIRQAEAANSPEVSMTGYSPFNSKVHNRMISGKIPVNDYLSQYVVPSLKEVIDVYDPDIMWYDAEWYNTSVNNKTNLITSYFYNKAIGKKEVVVNDRMGTDSRESHGDFYTSEYHVIIENLQHYWEENRPMGYSYGYNWQDNDSSLMSAGELIQMLVRIVARNGNLLLMICPDATGRIPNSQMARLNEIGRWLKLNGEAIYGTRSAPVSAEPSNTGDNVWYTQSKDGKFTYAIFFKWPSRGFMMLKNAKPKWETKVYLLGNDTPLNWYQAEGKESFMHLELPKGMNEKNSPGKYAWVIKYENW
jgi:alpha-L-fucosidase